MTVFPQHRIESAPRASRPALAAAAERFGMVPNLLAKLAESPAATHGYLELSRIFAEHADLTPAEQQVVLLAVSVENGCEYCVAAHSTLAQGDGVSSETIEALRRGEDPCEERLGALARFARTVVRERGWVPEEEQRAFFEAGFSPRHALDVVTGVALKTLSNYANHITRPELDEPFRAAAWRRPE